jgi:Tol biopolymer transport system component
VEVLPRFSPDGHWIAYQSEEETGRFEVYVQPWPGTGGKWQVSPGGGREPVWRRDGKELYYVTTFFVASAESSGSIMAVPIRTDSGFEFGTPQALFQTSMPVIPFCKYDVSADGQRFLVNSVVGEARANPITLIQNWTAEIKK